jgi:pimeloyl-ACP methyl ester carboxylesterase
MTLLRSSILPFAIAFTPALLACSSSDDNSPPSGPYQRGTCPFAVPQGVTVECGRLTVAENRNGATPQERGSLELAVGVFKARTPSPNSVPLVFLTGGPGEGALDDAALMWPAFAPLAEQRDLVVLDQRGTGYSKPALSCISVSPGDAAPSPDGLDILRNCRDALAPKVVSLSDFDTASNAADVDELRRALGYPAWDLFGVSYGTRLALTVARDFAAGTRSIAIDSVLPLQVDPFAEQGPNANRAFEHIFDGCAAQPSCAAAYPSLRQDFYDTLMALDTNPAMLKLDNGSMVPIGPDIIIRTLFILSYSAQVIPIIPQFIDQFHKGDFTILSALFQMMPSTMPSGSFAEGMNLSVTCREMAPFSSRDAIAKANEGLTPILRKYFSRPAPLDACDAWNVMPAPPVEHQPVMSDRPALVLEGDYDPVTPPAWGKAAASTLSHSTFVEIASQAHGTFREPCVLSILKQFLNDPSAAPDASCVQNIAPLVFLANQHEAMSKERIASLIEQIPPPVLEELRRNLRPRAL